MSAPQSGMTNSDDELEEAGPDLVELVEITRASYQSRQAQARIRGWRLWRATFAAPVFAVAPRPGFQARSSSSRPAGFGPPPPGRRAARDRRPLLPAAGDWRTGSPIRSMSHWSGTCGALRQERVAELAVVGDHEDPVRGRRAAARLHHRASETRSRITSSADRRPE